MRSRILVVATTAAAVTLLAGFSCLDRLRVGGGASGGAGRGDDHTLAHSMPPATGPQRSGAREHVRDLGRCRVFPRDNAWNQDISKDPVDPNSAAFLAAMDRGDRNLHPDFGGRGRYGIPWITVGAKQPKLPVTFSWPDECDPGPYPFPPDAPIEGNADAAGDRHVIVVDRDECKLYEAFACRFQHPGWECASGAIFDLRSNKARPHGFTSADAAGLPILPGLVRHDEVASGAIHHALRFTVRRTQRAYVHPATHYASHDRNPSLPPMGLRVRLKADFDVTPFYGTAKVILVALKRYGMFLADNGGDWFVTGEVDPRWDDADLRQLKTVPASAFEVVKLGTIHR